MNFSIYCHTQTFIEWVLMVLSPGTKQSQCGTGYIHLELTGYDTVSMLLQVGGLDQASTYAVLTQHHRTKSLHLLFSDFSTTKTLHL
jgi:hypothetical protein